MPNINTLIKDIYSLLEQRGGWFTDELAAQFSSKTVLALQENFVKSPKGTLRLSGMGNKCDREVWYSVHKPELAEPIQPWAMNKFCYGHILEAWAITLAKAAGHQVEGEQDELWVDGICGHRDCVIDGCIVDVKSVTTFGLEDLKTKAIATNDMFGRLFQLDGYLVASTDDNLVTVKDRGYLLGIDKTLGHMVLYEHVKREAAIRERIQRYKEIAGQSSPPACTCGTEPEGRSGNIRLATRASYNPFKHQCFPGLRTFLYSKGPVYLTKVERVPDVIEIK